MIKLYYVYFNLATYYFPTTRTSFNLTEGSFYIFTTVWSVTHIVSILKLILHGVRRILRNFDVSQQNRELVSQLERLPDDVFRRLLKAQLTTWMCL